MSTTDVPKRRPDPSDSRLRKVVLTFTVLIEEGAIDADRILDACEAAATLLGVQKGDILPGARLAIESPE